jgi:hypothetical protein
MYIGVCVCVHMHMSMEPHFIASVTPWPISLFRRAFQFTTCNGPTNALVCNKTLIQMSHIKTLKISPTCFDHQLIIETCWSDFKCFNV